MHTRSPGPRRGATPQTAVRIPLRELTRAELESLKQGVLGERIHLTEGDLAALEDEFRRRAAAHFEHAAEIDAVREARGELRP